MMVQSGLPAGPLRHAVGGGERRFVRIAVGQTRTTGDDVERLWNVIAQAAEAARQDGL